jgi:deoxyribodipyrimidine photolyase-related protein
MKPEKKIRRLIIVLGDQLNMDSTAFEGASKATDAVWMAEASAEARSKQTGGPVTIMSWIQAALIHWARYWPMI